MRPRFRGVFRKNAETQRRRDAERSFQNAVILNGGQEALRPDRSEESLTLRGRRRSGEMREPSLPPPPPIYFQRFFTAFRPRLRPRRNSVQNDGRFFRTEPPAVFPPSRFSDLLRTHSTSLRSAQGWFLILGFQIFPLCRRKIQRKKQASASAADFPCPSPSPLNTTKC